MGITVVAGEVEVETDGATPNHHLTMKCCRYCMSEIRQGVKHICNITSRRKNISEIVRTTSDPTLETVTGGAVKEVATRQDTGDITLQSGFGGSNPLRVQIGTKPKEQ